MRRIKIVSGILAGVLSIASAGILYVTKNEAHNLITAPLETRMSETTTRQSHRAIGGCVMVLRFAFTTFRSAREPLVRTVN